MGLLRRKEVAERLNISVPCLYNWVKSGAFVAPFYVGSRTPFWNEEDVDKWLQNKKSTGEANGTEGKAESLCPA